MTDKPSNYERFLTVLLELSDVYGIEDVDVNHYVDLLAKAIERYTFNSQGNRKKRSTPRSKFISIFQNRYLEMTDLPWTKNVTALDAKIIGLVCDKLEQKHSSPEDYLEWVFDVFIQENPKFMPPTIKFVCSDFCIAKFFTDNKDVLERQHKATLEMKEKNDLLGRARVLYRKTKNEDIVTFLKEFSVGIKSLFDLRKFVSGLEEKYKENAELGSVVNNIVKKSKVNGNGE